MATKKVAIGYTEAITTVLKNIVPLNGGAALLADCVDRVAAEDLYATVNSPSVDASLKDGFAVRSKDIEKAAPGVPVRLRVIGTAAAGMPSPEIVSAGTAVRILTGAKIPGGADAVLAEEFAHIEDEYVVVSNIAEPGRNIFLKGGDVALGQCICDRGTRLTPGALGILAAAGFGEIPIFKRPAVGLIATGDEVVAVGQPLPEGKLYASNMVTLNAWCRRYGMETTLWVVRDERKVLETCIREALLSCDAIITSGGAWTGDRDLVALILDDLGWKKYFHRIRLGPGKAVGFGILQRKPVFILPGGPPSNLTAFLQIALPGLMKLCGYTDPHLPTATVVLDRGIKVRTESWTQFVFGRLQIEENHMLFSPLQTKSRLQAIARADAMICIPEGVSGMTKGAVVQAQLLT